MDADRRKLIDRRVADRYGPRDRDDSHEPVCSAQRGDAGIIRVATGRDGHSTLGRPWAAGVGLRGAKGNRRALRQRSAPICFRITTSVIAGLLAGVNLAPKAPVTARLREKRRFSARQLTALGSAHPRRDPIIPIMVGDASLAIAWRAGLGRRDYAWGSGTRCTGRSGDFVSRCRQTISTNSFCERAQLATGGRHWVSSSRRKRGKLVKTEA